MLAQAAEIARSNEQDSPEWQKLETCLPQWRTWLCWFTFDGFLSLGFGRPQSTQFETVDEYGFLQMRLNGPLPRPGSVSSHALYGDVYIAGQVQLAQIGRDLINWGEMLADPEKAIYADPRRAEIFRDTELSVKTMFSDLNARLDEYCRTWVWTGEFAFNCFWSYTADVRRRLAIRPLSWSIRPSRSTPSRAPSPLSQFLRAQGRNGTRRSLLAMFTQCLRRRSQYDTNTPRIEPNRPGTEFWHGRESLTRHTSDG